ncbi:MAG: DUF3244 domain-containing protein [Bacteroides cellulosilyticus]
MGSISLQAQDRFSFADDDEREIPLDPVGSKEGGPIARSIIIQPASAYVNSDIVTVVFNKDLPSASITITNVSTGAVVYSEIYSMPTLITINVSAENSGEYQIEIVSDEIRLSGYFTL